VFVEGPDDRNGGGSAVRWTTPDTFCGSRPVRPVLIARRIELSAVKPGIFTFALFRTLIEGSYVQL
jgi:hypothetical protein